MAKKKRIRKKSGGMKLDKKLRAAEPDAADDIGDKKFQYGGLPERSLKKNLGC